MSVSPFASTEQFRQHFTHGLSRLLREPGLGAYVLAHANASFDRELFDTLRPQLLKGYNRLAKQCRERFAANPQADRASDDLSVFLKLMSIGFDGGQMTRFRTLNDWELQFNHLRAFRPSRMTAEQVTGISRPFNPAEFHFNKPFLRHEVFWTGELLGEQVEFLYNKFPFVSLHGLLPLNREAQHPQLLTRHYHEYVWRLCETLGVNLPGWGVGYNSYGAYASVNHLHFQTFLRDTPLPVTRDVWEHLGGNRPYPLKCEVYGAMEEAWQRIESLHRAVCSYNLIYRPGRLYCLPRRTQGTYEAATWNSGFAWYEVAGGFTTASVEAFEHLDDTTIVRELAKLNLSV
ncbi:MAG: hypothetical protein PVI92_09130 [Chromatiales bacterium]|jgi:hypothetical protein